MKATAESKKKRFMGGIVWTYVKVYDKCKYDADAELIAEVDYERTKEFAILNSADFEPGALEGIDPDPYDEYLVIWNEDGTTATFRNSYVSMFKI